MKPIMTDLRISSPCEQSWAGMTPDGRGRHCASCAKTVVDVTAMAPDQGRTFVAKELPARLARGERVCVRVHADTRGRLLRPGVRRYLLTNGLAAVLAMTMAGCGGEPPVVTDGMTCSPALQTQPAPDAPAPVQPVMGKPAPAQLPVDEPMMGIMASPIRGEVGPAITPDRAPATGNAGPAMLGEMVGEVEAPAASPLMGSPTPPVVTGYLAAPAR